MLVRLAVFREALLRCSLIRVGVEDYQRIFARVTSRPLFRNDAELDMILSRIHYVEIQQFSSAPTINQALVLFFNSAVSNFWLMVPTYHSIIIAKRDRQFRYLDSVDDY